MIRRSVKADCPRYAYRVGPHGKIVVSPHLTLNVELVADASCKRLNRMSTRFPGFRMFVGKVQLRSRISVVPGRDACAAANHLDQRVRLRPSAVFRPCAELVWQKSPSLRVPGLG
jgi:hypothetical protein